MSYDKKPTTALTTLRKEPVELKVKEAGGLNAYLTALSLDEPGPGNACHLYTIEVNGVPAVQLNFQRGPVKEVGVNGLSNEVLLLVVAHRFEGFQQGEFACEENAVALKGIYQALEAMAKRTKGRIERQVEGYNKK